MVTSKSARLVLTVCIVVLAAGSASQVSSSGQPVSTWFPISPLDTPDLNEWFSSVAYNSLRQEYLVVWQGSASSDRFVYGQRVYHDGDLRGSPFMISAASGQNLYPDVAYNPHRNEYLVVYMVQSGGAGIYDIRGWRIDANGVQQGSELTFADAPADHTELYPAVAYATEGDVYLVAWQNEFGTDQKGIEVRSLSGGGGSMGSIVEVTGMQATLAPSRPDVAYMPTLDDFLVVWQRWSDINQTDHDILAQRIALDGGAHLEGPTFSMHYTTNEEIEPAIASVVGPSGTSEWLVVCRYFDAGSWYVAGRFMTDWGSSHDWTLISPPGASLPAVAGNENTHEFLVAWDAGSSIQARTITTSGVVGASSQAGPYGLDPSAPAVAAGTRSGYLVTGHDQFVGYNPDVYGFLWANHVLLPLVLKNG